MSRSSRIGYQPQADRTQFVFLNACGCPRGVIEGSYAKTEDGAWDRMAETRTEERQMRRNGVTVVHVTHAEYSATYYPMMLAKCTHRASTAPSAA